jgi:hypothetical protein
MRKTWFFSGVLMSILGAAVFGSAPGRASPPATPTAFPLPTQAFPTSPTPVVTPGAVSIGSAVNAGKLAAETSHFRIYAGNGHLPVNLESFTREAEEIFDYVSARLETSTETKTAVVFQPPFPSSCPGRGATTVSEGLSPIIFIYADDQTSHDQILGVLAHEVAHALQQIGTGRDWDSRHLPLNEGLATWTAGQYWYAWKGILSFDAAVQSYLDHSSYLPLYENYDMSLAYAGEGCLEQRDILYTEWAAFIDYLLTTYGSDQFEALLHSAPPEEVQGDSGTMLVYPSADFETIYGSALNQLEARWLCSLGK